MSAAKRRACERCWKRKQKCDKQTPTCSNCAEANASCAPRSLTYTPAPDQLGLAIERGDSYIHSLKRKVDHLQTLQANKQARTASNATGHGLENNNEEPNHDNDHDQPRPSDQDNTAATSQVDPMEHHRSRETLNEFGSLVLTAMAEPGDHDIVSALSTTAFLTAEAGALPKPDNPLSAFLNQSQSDFDFPFEATVYFLDRFKAVFDKRYSLDYAELAHDHGLVVSRHSDRHRADGELAFVFAFVYLAVAIGILISPEGRNHHSLAFILHQAAVNAISHSDLDQAPMSGLRCLLALTIFALYSNRGGCPWRLINMAAQRAVLLGIHRASPVQKDNLTASRRLFISLYLLERSVSSSMHRPFALQDEDISPVFLHANDTQSKQPRADRLHLIDQAQLISSVGGELLFQFSSFRHWEETLPLDFGHVESNDDGPIDTNSHLLQLSCRTLVKICLSDLQGVHQCMLSMFENEENLEEQTLSRARGFVRLLHKSLEDGILVPCRLDVYDLVSACIVCVLTVEGVTCSNHPALTELLRMTFALLNAMAAMFEEARSFKKVLESVLGLKFVDSGSIGVVIPEDDLLLSLIDSPGKVPRFVRNALHDLRQTHLRRTWTEPPPQFPQHVIDITPHVF